MRETEIVAQLTLDGWTFEQANELVREWLESDMDWGEWIAELEWRAA